MSKKIAGLIFGLSLFILNGCATIGHDFTVAEIPRIKIGETTQHEIEAMFGSPWRTGLEDGKVTWTYGKYHYSLFSVPSATDLVIRFDSHGIVSSYSFNSTLEHHND